MGYFTKRGTHGKETFEKGRFIVPGTYDLRVKDYKLQESRKPGKLGQVSLICTFIILACDDVDAEPGRTGPKFKAGQECTWHVNMALGDSADSKIKEHFRVLFPDVDPDTPEFDVTVDACLEEDIAGDMVIGGHAYHTVKPDGELFTLVAWYPIDDPADAF